MILRNKRDKEINLYPQLEDADSTILVLSGGPKAVLVHDYTQEAGVLEPWQVCFLIEDFSILEQTEKDSWFGGANPENYIVFGGEDTAQQAGADGPNKKKLVADQGSTSSLMVSDTKVDKIAVSDVFAKGDML